MNPCAEQRILRFQPGERVKLNAAECKKAGGKWHHMDRLGTVAGLSKRDPDCVLVIWDGTKYKCKISQTFLESA